MIEFLAGLYEPERATVYFIVGLILTISTITSKPYKILGFFFTRKFKPAKNLHKYAIMIAARNEEAVIGNLLNSIKKQDYPAELLTVFVVADNCTDNTAKVAREHGAICYERFNDTDKTKGFALQFLVENIKADYGIESFEGYFIFDADNLLKQDYISRMNDSFDSGEKIITSYRNTKNWTESWIASTYALHWLRSIRFNHRARSFLHLATNIQGTGFLFTNEIIRDGWKYTSLTEDRALTADCVVQGYEISYNDQAVFYDEQPVSLKVALRQRLRWSKGHILAFGESGFGLFKNIFIDRTTKKKPGDKWYHFFFRSLRHRFMSFDTFCQLMPKHIIKITNWIICYLILYPCSKSIMGFTKNNLLANGTPLGNFVTETLGLQISLDFGPGLSTLFICIAVMLIENLWRRICYYLTNTVTAVYLFIVEHKRIVKMSIWRKLLYCLTWPTFDIIGRYTQYLALFKKVTWKPIPHESKITIEDIKESAVAP